MPRVQRGKVAAISTRWTRRVAAPCVCFVPWAALASCRPLPQQLLPVSAAGGGRRRCTFFALLRLIGPSAAAAAAPRRGAGCALSVTFGDTLSPFLSLRDIFPRPGEVFQRERQEALPLRPWLPFKRKARSVPSTLLALPPGELANPKGLTERVCFSPSCGFPAGATLPQGASGSRYRSPLRPLP